MMSEYEELVLQMQAEDEEKIPVEEAVEEGVDEDEDDDDDIFEDDEEDDEDDVEIVEDSSTEE